MNKSILLKQVVLFAAAVLFLAVPWQRGQTQTAQLPTATSSLFSGSGNCARCHAASGASTALRDSQGNDISPVTDWRSTMMANAASDPFWQAQVESEVVDLPHLKTVIEDTCNRCHTPMGRTQAIHDGATSYSLDQARASALALDGVSCTLCHQIQPDNLGTEQSFTGRYVINASRQIFGPYVNVLQMPMQQQVNYTPLFGNQIKASALCASCHTVFTPYVNDQGQVAGTFPEQVSYLEWQNSVYAAQNQSCQDCHMPRVDQAIKIATQPPFLSNTQQPFWRHTLVGGNAFMLRMLRDHGATLGVTATTEQFNQTIAHTQALLQLASVRLTPTAAIQGNQLTLRVELENLSGHKFPTGYPSRRAWLHVRVQDASGKKIFESGAVDANGRIPGLTAGVEPHRDVITAENQAQIYESVMKDVNGAATETLLRGAGYLKDNRLPPRGFVTTAARYTDMAIQGDAASDPNFNRVANSEGTGRDTVTYQIDVAGQSGELIVLTELLYQSARPSSIDSLLTHNTAAVTRFNGYYASADKAPERVQSVTQRVLLSPRTVVSVSAASYNAPPLAESSLVTAFGNGLATTTLSAAGTPLPTALAGTTVRVKDSAGTDRLAPLLFVSPTQINYLMPPGTVNSAATVTITSGDGVVSTGIAQIATVAPGLFAANADGQGVAAAVVLRIKADGTQQFEPVVRFDSTLNRFVAVPIDLGPETDQVFLLLFGTAIRNRSLLSAVSASIGGTDAQVLYAGPQPDFVGLDQINLRIPRSLIGRGEVSIALFVDGKAANNVNVKIQ